MEFLGIGPLELLFILLIALLVIGPKDMAKSARTFGKHLNRLYKSEAWKTVMDASQTIRTLPDRLAREAALEELDETRDLINQTSREIDDAARETTAGLEAWTKPVDPIEGVESDEATQNTSADDSASQENEAAGDAGAKA